MQNSLRLLRDSQDSSEGKSVYDQILRQAQRLVLLICRARPDSSSGAVIYPELPPIDYCDSIAVDDTVRPVALTQSVKDRDLPHREHDISSPWKLPLALSNLEPSQCLPTELDATVPVSCYPQCRVVGLADVACPNLC